MCRFVFLPGLNLPKKRPSSLLFMILTRGLGIFFIYERYFYFFPGSMIQRPYSPLSKFDTAEDELRPLYLFLDSLFVLPCNKLFWVNVF